MSTYGSGGFVGMHTMTGIPRFTFGSVFLYGHFNLAVFIMGFFGLPEMIDLLTTGQASISRVEKGKIGFRDTLEGLKDVFRHWGLWLRSSLIGYFVGTIPGAGAGTAVWVAYGSAKQTSKTPEKFGTGCVEGVIAPEAADNAAAAGTLLTTMTFGIPASTSGAIFLGAFMLVGLVPGPAMVKDSLPLIFALLAGIAIANLIGGMICLGTASYLGKIAFVPTDFMFPIITSVILVAAVVTDGELLDLLTVLFSGLLGVCITKFGFSRAALSLGFVLGGLFEYYFLISLKLHGPLFFVKPSCLIMVGILVLLFGYRSLAARLKRTS